MGFEKIKEVYRQKSEKWEKIRISTLGEVLNALDDLEKETTFENAHIFGSVTRPYRFHESSDIDIAFEGLDRDRLFVAVAFLSRRLERDVNGQHLEDIAELDAQWTEIRRGHASVKHKAQSLRGNISNEDLAESLAYRLHNLYCAYEDLFKLVAGFFENQLENSSRYHTDLLRRMMLDMEGIRPRLLSEDSLKILDELRGFRHVFRHAYSYGMDAERVVKLAEKTTSLNAAFAEDLDRFKDELRPAKD
ncbi:MAG: hypothetical protein HYU64_05530 [Armatimonadetes bacterium]|nr:hypothetical protein [Armatimonadota bacterium]